MYHECRCGTPHPTSLAEADPSPRAPGRHCQSPCRGDTSLAELYAEGLPYTAAPVCGVVESRTGTVLRCPGSIRWHVLAVLTPEAWLDNPTAARIAAFEWSHPAVEYRVVTPVQANHLLSQRRINPVAPAPLFLVLNAAFEEVYAWTDTTRPAESWSWLPFRRPAKRSPSPLAGDPVIVLEHLAA